MDAFSEKRKGEWYLLTGVLFWAFFPIVTALSYAKLSALFSLAWATLFSAVFFGCIIAYRRTWREIANPILWRYVFFVTLFIGVLYYGFYFTGLERTTPGNAALIAQFEIVTAFLFFNVFRKEYISFENIVGVFLMVFGALIILAPNFSGINVGDFLILGATFFPPVGNLFQQKAREIAASEVIMFLRSALAVPFIFILAYLVSPHASIVDVRGSLAYLLINGVLLLGLSKIFWLEAIHRMSVTKANALLGAGPLLTLLFSWVLLHQVPTVWQMASLLPFIFGTLLLTDNIKLKCT